MAINKNFTVKNGLEVNTSLIFADADARRVGILVTEPIHDLHVNGGVGVTNLVVAGVSTFSGISTFSNNVYVSGITTADGGVSTGVTALTVIGDLRVTGDIFADDIEFDIGDLTELNVTGITTSKNLDITGIGTLQNLVVNGGTVLSGLTTLGPLAPGFTTTFHAAVGIQSGGTVIGTGVTTINFAGIGATLVTVSGSTANVFVSGGDAGISSVGIQSSGTFIGSGTTLNFYGPGITSVSIDPDGIAHINVGVTTLGFKNQTYNVGVTTNTFAFTAGYSTSPGSIIEVYINGVRQLSGTDFTATDGTNVVLAFDAINSDVVEILTYSAPIGEVLGGYIVRRNFIANQDQTVFPFSGGYLVGDLDVYLNGTRLLYNNDFTASNGTTFTLTEGAKEGDLVEAVTHQQPFVGAAGSYIQLQDDNTVIGLANNLNFGSGITVSAYSSSTGVATVSLDNNIVVGVVTATSFIGDGSGLTGIVGSGSGVIVQDNGSLVGTAGTINFGPNLSVSPISSGIVTVTASDSGITVQDGGSTIGSGITFINFAANLSVSTAVSGIVTVTASGGGGGGGESYWGSTLVGIHTLSNVGVGTTNPTSPLTVKGNTSLETLNVSGNTTLSQLNASQVNVGSGATTTTTISGGLVGIATTNPTSKLSVDIYGIETGIGTFSAIPGVGRIIDSFTISQTDFKAVEYTIHVGFGVSTQTQKVLATHYAGSAYYQEYGIMYHPSSSIVSVAATVGSGVFRLQITPESGINGLTTYRFVRQSLL